MNAFAIRLVTVLVIRPLGWIEASIVAARNTVRRWSGEPPL